jgi:hypothetical protein
MTTTNTTTKLTISAGIVVSTGVIGNVTRETPDERGVVSYDSQGSGMFANNINSIRRRIVLTFRQGDAMAKHFDFLLDQQKKGINPTSLIIMSTESRKNVAGVYKNSYKTFFIIQKQLTDNMVFSQTGERLAGVEFTIEGTQAYDVNEDVFIPE